MISDARRALLSLIASTLFLAVLLLALQPIPAGAQDLTFADGLVFNDFFAVVVHFGGEEDFTLFDVSALEGDTLPLPDADGDFGDRRGAGPADEMKYFFWVRRMGPTGAVTYPLPFRRIKEIRFTGPSGRLGDQTAQKGSLTVGGETLDVAVRISDDRISGWVGDFPERVPSYAPAVLVLTDGSEQQIMLKTDGFLGGIDEEFGTYGLLWLMSDGILSLEFLNDGTYARCPECGAIFYDSELETCPFDGTELVPSVPR